MEGGHFLLKEHVKSNEKQDEIADLLATDRF